MSEKQPGMTQEQLQRSVELLNDKARECIPMTASEHPDCLVFMGNPATGDMSLSFETPVNEGQPGPVRMALCAAWLRKALVSILSDPEAAQAFARLQSGGESPREVN